MQTRTHRPRRPCPAVAVHERFGHYAVIHLNMAGIGSPWKVWNDKTNQGAYDALNRADAVRTGRWLAGEGTL